MKDTVANPAWTLFSAFMIDYLETRDCRFENEIQELADSRGRHPFGQRHERAPISYGLFNWRDFSAHWPRKLSRDQFQKM